MVDTTTLIVLSTVVQTIVISITLVIFILQFRSQEKAIKESSYQNLMGRYNDFMTIQAEKPEPSALLRDWLQSRNGDRKIAAEDISVIANLLIAYGIIEEAFLLLRRNGLTKRHGNSGPRG